VLKCVAPWTSVRPSVTTRAASSLQPGRYYV